MKKFIWINTLFALVVTLFLASCTKSTFLDARPDQSLIVPTSLTDLQEVLDNDLVINGSGNYGIVPALGETGADDYYCNDDAYNTNLSPLYKNAYVWAKNIYSGETVYDWNFPYRAVFYANIVLDGLNKIPLTSDNRKDWNNERGEALFIRAHMFYELAQVFAPPYSADNTGKLGIPLRLQADINEKLTRSSLQQTYDQIISDLKEAVPLLPVNPLYKTRPSKPAAYALLARVYLSMSDYAPAGLYADSCLSLDDSLMDYNELDTTSWTPFARFNSEVIFNCTMQSTDLVPFLPFVGGFVDTILYNSYDANDLRRAVFFKNLGNGGNTFLGTYDGNYYPFAGLATDEVYLIEAECYARQGKVTEAMSALNTLLATRWKTGTFVPLTASSPGQALSLILSERRKELCFRGLRWTDLRRLNQDPSYAITLNRTINGVQYQLAPGDPRYTYPIPDYVLSFNPGMQQNIR